MLPPFDESHFRDYRDENGKIVHSIGSFLTVWTSLATAADKPANVAAKKPATPPAAPKPNDKSKNANTNKKNDPNANKPSTGDPNNPAAPAAAAPGVKKSDDSNGWVVNVNTAPPAVLKALFDDREVHPRLWDKVVEYRNLEEEEDKNKVKDKSTEEPPQLDEYGEEIIKRRIFDSVSELGEVDGFKDLGAELQTKISQCLSVQSHVFSIFVIARRPTSVEGDMSEALADKKSRVAADEKGDSLLRVVRSVVWRHKVDDKIVIVPLVRWEVLDYMPYEVLDYPDENR